MVLLQAGKVGIASPDLTGLKSRIFRDFLPPMWPPFRSSGAKSATIPFGDRGPEDLWSLVLSAGTRPAPGILRGIVPQFNLIIGNNESAALTGREKLSFFRYIDGDKMSQHLPLAYHRLFVAAERPAIPTGRGCNDRRQRGGGNLWRFHPEDRAQNAAQSRSAGSWDFRRMRER